MAFCILTGKIYFTSVPPDNDIINMKNDNEIINISYFLSEKAINNRLGLNLYCNLTAKGLYKYPLRNYLKDGYIPYEILDDPLSSECIKIFNGVWYTDKTWKIAFAEKSRLPAVQKFFEDIIVHEKISYITLEIQDEHAWPIEYIDYEIRADQFCQTIMDAPNDKCFEMPPLRLKIVKQ